MAPSEQSEAQPGDISDRAHSYAWAWFEYHANQRMNSFNFFFVLEGALTAAYLTAIGSDRCLLAFGFGVLLLVAAGMFWRLDLRNSQLVKIAEKYLAESEKRMAVSVGTAIQLVKEAEEPTDELVLGFAPTVLATYRRIYRAIFVSVVAFSIFAMAYAIWLFVHE